MGNVTHQVQQGELGQPFEWIIRQRFQFIVLQLQRFKFAAYCKRLVGDPSLRAFPDVVI